MEHLILKLNNDGNPFASTRNYNKLVNKPTINGQEISGDVTSEGLHIVVQKTVEEWAADPEYIPVAGEICLFLGTNNIKIGDGTTAINELPYVSAEFNTLRDDGDGLFVSSINV